MACTNPVIINLTPVDFQNQFFRGFTYVPNWDIGTPYNLGNQIFYTANNKFYEAIQSVIAGILPTDTNNWQEIAGDNLVSTLDITNAYGEACVTFNSALFGDDGDLKLAYLYLSAHYLVYDLNAGGLDSPNDSGLLSSRSVSNVSESYAIPTWQTKTPSASFFSTTSYGRKYWQMVSVRTIGTSIFTVPGATRP